MVNMHIQTKTKKKKKTIRTKIGINRETKLSSSQQDDRIGNETIQFSVEPSIILS